MKQQIQRLTPHQNGKVFGILTALASLVLAVPMFLVMTFAGPARDGPPALVFLVFPIVYLVAGYLSVAIGCLVYNAMFKYIGGIEYESSERAP